MQVRCQNLSTEPSLNHQSLTVEVNCI